MSKTISLWDYINYNNTQLNNRFKEQFNIEKLPRDCKSSKSFLNIYMKEQITNNDFIFLKNVYNAYFDYKLKNDE